MDAPLQYIVLTPGQAPEVGAHPITYDQMVTSVGFPMSVFNLQIGATLYYCGEGDLRDWPVNEAATKVADGWLRDGHHIYGNALVLGLPGPGGRPGSLSDEARDEVLAVLS